MAQKNNRSTTAKTAISDLIEASNIALSHQDIQKEIGDLCNRVTIYRVLDRLVEEGEIHKVVDFDGIAKYSSCDHCDDEHEHHHVHFSCTACSEVTCLHHVIPKFDLPTKYLISELNFTMSGICPKCT